jgi:hypothetical protein
VSTCVKKRDEIKRNKGASWPRASRWRLDSQQLRILESSRIIYGNGAERVTIQALPFSHEGRASGLLEMTGEDETHAQSLHGQKSSNKGARERTH